MNTTPKQTRDLQRLLHLVFAAALGTYIYSPWGAIPMFALVMKVAIFPALSVTGLLLWKWQQMKRRLRASRLSEAAIGDADLDRA